MPPSPGASPASEAAPSAETVRTALGGRAFWMLTSAVVLSGLAAAATVVHFIPFLLGRRFPLSTAAFAAGGIGLMQLPGRLFYMPIRRRLSIFGSTATVLLVQAFALAWLPMVRGRIGLAVFVIAFGMGNGAATLVRATGIAELFDPAVYGRIGGLVALFTAVARASGPIAAALAYQKLGSYSAVFWALAALLAIGAATLQLTRSDTSSPPPGVDGWQRSTGAGACTPPRAVMRIDTDGRKTRSGIRRSTRTPTTVPIRTPAMAATISGQSGVSERPSVQM